MTETLSIDLPDEVFEGIHGLLDKACEQHCVLATAESCTGGLLASLLTDVEGKSHIFDRGFLVYSDKAKTAMLGVPRTLIADHGSVSQQVAVAMAEGALDRSDADIAIAITGFAGPAGPTDEEGLVHYACARRGAQTRHREAHYGACGRGNVRINCIRTSIEMMHQQLAA